MTVTDHTPRHADALETLRGTLVQVRTTVGTATGTLVDIGYADDGTLDTLHLDGCGGPVRIAWETVDAVRGGVPA